MIKPRAAISWSGGKDSCLALLRAREQGFDVTTFLTMCDLDGSSKSHALEPSLVAAQVHALGGRWQAERAAFADYGRVFADALQRLRSEGHTHMIFGDIDLAAHRDWLEPMCAHTGLAAVFPLWGEERAALAKEVLMRGIRARIVCVDTRWLDETFCGAEYDKAFLARLPAGVCPVGEEGEFHTFVVEAPGFANALVVRADAPRRVRSSPPFAPTEFVMQSLELLE